MKNRKIELLMYAPLSLRMGAGGERWLAEVAPRLIGRNILPTILTTDFVAKGYSGSFSTWAIERIRKSGIPYAEKRTLHGFHRAGIPLLTARSISDLARTMSVADVVYFINAYASQDLSVLLAKKLRSNVPVISAQHSLIHQDRPFHDLYVTAISRGVLRGFDAYHVLNKEDRETYRGWGLRHIYLIPNGVDVKRFTPAPNDHGQFIVLFAGRLDYQKGIDTLIRAVLKLESGGSPAAHGAIFRVCGTGPLKESVERFSTHRRNFEYLGYVTDDQLVKLYGSASLFVMPSRFETFGIVALEAMASGVPVLATNIPGPRSFILKGFGHLVPPGNPDLLAEAIRWFYDEWVKDPKSLTEMGQTARQQCVQKYDWERIADRVSDMIRQTAEYRLEKL